MGGLVAALVEVRAEPLRKVFRVHADEFEGDDHRHAPVPDAALEVLRTLVLGDAEDLLHLFRGPLDAVGTAGALGRQDLAQRVDLEVIVLAPVRILHEELDAAVLPLGAVVFRVLGAEVQAAHAEIDHQGVLGPGDAAGAEGRVGEFGGPVDPVHLETGAFQFKGGVEVHLLEVGDKGYFDRIHHKACMSLSRL